MSLTKSSKRSRALIGLLAAVSLALSTAVVNVPVVQAAPKAEEFPLPPVQREEPVPVMPVPVKVESTELVPGRALKNAPQATLPRSQRADAEVRADRMTKAGTSPVSVGRGKSGTAPGRVSVEVIDSTKSPLGASAVTFTVSPSSRDQAPGQVRLAVDYSSFRDVFGADWASRLTLKSLPDCASTTPAKSECAPKQLEAVNDAKTATVTVENVEMGTFALTSGPTGGVGDFKASSLSPSSTWSGGGSSGDFTWSYPIRVPPSLGGPAPKMSLSYSSGSVDGRTASTNNQPSWVGEGFDLSVGGSIERRYKACADDLGGNNGQTKTGDLCWGNDNAFVTLGGKATELIHDDATGVWKLKDDDGSLVEKITSSGNGDNNSESWRITTIDGTKYTFGTIAATNSTWTVPVFGNNSGEDCYQATFAASSCQQAYRWNLDSVLDPHGNTATYFYQTESNLYGRNNGSVGATYHRGGWLDRIEYGTRTNISGQAPMRVQFTAGDRCVTQGATCVSSNPSNWPDVPWDQNCSSGTCPTQTSPTFWTQKQLDKITTQVWGGSAYRDVDSWTLIHQFLNPGDGTSSALWLKTIRQSGLVGTATTVPDVTFNEVPLSNRVDGIDTLAPIVRYRISSVINGTGGQIAVQYSARECSRTGTMPTAPDSNTMRCFPVYWTPSGQPQLLDWFHKYVVTSVTEKDDTGGGRPVLTTYEYLGTPAWHFDDEDGLVPVDRKTWSQWRGYGQVGVVVGDTTVTRTRSVTTYLRGMDDDKLSNGTRRNVFVPDSWGGTTEDQELLAGYPRERITYKAFGDNTVLSSTLTTPWVSPAKATNVRPWGTETANLVANTSTKSKIALEGNAWRTTQIDTTVDPATGLPTAVSDVGDIATAADDQCTRTTYAANTSAWMLSYAVRIETVGVACTTPATYPADLVSDARTYYDGALTHTTAPTKGDITKSEVAESWSSGVPNYVTTGRALADQYGRTIESWDAADKHSTLAYTPASGGPVTSTVATNALGHQATTVLEPAWGLPTKVTDANSRRIDVTRDGLGRVLKVWAPGRDKATQPANTEYEYTIRTTGANVVTTKSLRPDGATYTYSYAFFDGLLRPRQTQNASPGVAGGRVLTESIYDSRGAVFKANGPFFDTGVADTTLMTPVDETKVPTQTVAEFDGAGRVTASIFREKTVEKWRTTTAYGGDRVHTTPPSGANPTTVITDARGQTTELRQYTGTTPTGTFRPTTYTYTDAGQLATVTDGDNNVWRNFYDLRGLKTRAEDPANGVTTSSYDAAGRLRTTIDARGNTLAYTYDDLSRTTTVRDGSVTGTKRAEWTYDPTGNLGLPASSIRYDNGNAYTTKIDGYDAGGRPTGSTTTIPAAEGVLAGNYTTTATYKPDGSPATNSLPGVGGLPAETLTYGYNTLGLPNTLDGATSYVKGTSYSDLGELGQFSTSTATTGKKVTQTFNYELGTRRLSQIKVDRQLTGSNQGLINYSYDPAGNVTRIADKPTTAGLSADIQCFRYDAFQRVTDAWTPATDNCPATPTTAALGGPAPYWQSFEYDGMGNRTKETQHAGTGDTTRIYTYPPVGQPRRTSATQVTTTKPGQSATTDTFTYNNAGDTLTRNIAGQPGHTLTWTAEGQLDTDTPTGGQATTFLYDANGTRLLRRDPTHTTLYLGHTELKLERSTGTITGTRYYSHAGRTIGVRTPTALSWLVGDHQNTTLFTADPATLAFDRKRHLPFGGDRGTAPTSWIGDHGFLDAPKDTTTGLTHLGAREYDSTNGRFISVDPLLDVTNSEQMNGYTYANNSPITYSDPSGLISDMDNPKQERVYWNECHARGQCHGTAPSGTKQALADAIADTAYKTNKPLGKKVDSALIRAVSNATTDQEALDAFNGWVFQNGTTCESLFQGTSYLSVCVSNGASPTFEADLGGMYAELGNAAAQQFIDMIELGAVVLGAMAVAVACQACMAVVAAASPEIPVLALGAAATTVGIGATRVGVGLTGDAKAARWGLGCLTHSFAPDTPVLMADGTTKRIDEIEIGDQVLTTDPETDATTTRPVTAIHRHRDTDLTDLTIVDDHGNQAILRTTQHHQIWDDTHHTWTDASQLRPGAALRTPTEAAVHVAGTANRTGTATMHDLTIADIHTYYVMAGETPVLVHNTGLTCETGRSLWQLTKDGASVMKRGGPFNTTFYKSASDGTWWTADTAGHGGSAFKVFEETKKGLQWIADADRYGNYISGKWKSSTGMFIPWSQLKGAG